MSATPEERTKRLGRLDWQFKNLKGARFGRLKVLGTDGKDPAGHYQWRCLCDCGKRKVINGTSLRLARTSSCGECAKFRAIAQRIAHLSFRQAITLADALAREIEPDKLAEIFKIGSHQAA